MGALTEVEIFDCMQHNFRVAITCCEALARRPSGGVTYDRFRRALRMIEGCCKQANCWREDTRWLSIGRMMAEVHKRAGDWLRGIVQEDGTRRAVPRGELHPAFEMLAEHLNGFMKVAEQIRTQATGRIGMILPEPLPGPHRDTRPVGWRRTGTGLLVPAGA